MPAQKLTMENTYASFRHWLTNHCSLSTANSQKGVSQLVLIGVLVLGIGLATYLVQTRTNLLPQAAEPNCQKVARTGRAETVLPDGRLQITFNWADGRETYDFKSVPQPDGDRTLIPSQTRGKLADGTTITKSGAEKKSGSTVTQAWSDGSIQYNEVTTGINHQGIAGERIETSYLMVPSTKGGSCDSNSKSTPKTSTKTNSQSGGNQQTSNQSTAKTNQTPAQNTPLASKAPAPASPTPLASTIATYNSSAIVTQFESLQVIFEQTLVANITAAGKQTVPDLQKLITITRNSISAGLNSAKECVQTKAADCAQKLPPLLNYSKVATRLTAFYAIINGTPQTCSRADFGIAPVLNATSGLITGPIYLCTSESGNDIKWRVFQDNTPLPINDPNYPPFLIPATCTDLKWPQAVIDHLASAQVLIFKTIPTVCGKSSNGAPNPENVLEGPL